MAIGKSLVQKYHERLRDKEVELVQEIDDESRARAEKLRAADDLSHLPTHNADRDSEGVGEEVAIENTLREELGAVQAALQRIREGNFGACERCGEEIAAERLDALPWTAYCIDCERDLEQRGEGAQPARAPWERNT